MNVFDHPEFDNHEQVIFCADKKSGLKAIIAIHNTSRGPATGGCRMFPYASMDDALTDVLRLSKGMTFKSAMANLNFGGGKSVIIGDPKATNKTEIMLAMGNFIESLSGKYVAAEDSGTSVQDMQTMSLVTKHVSGTKESHSHNGDPSPYTAYGTYLGIKEAVKHRLGTTNLNGIKVAIQGVGNVGFHLAKHLNEEGAELIVSDVSLENLARVKREFKVTSVEPSKIYEVEADVFAPCAMGGILNDESIEVLKAPVVAGAANNQLQEERHGKLLIKKGILYAPDFVINAGGIIDIAYQNNDDNHAAIMSHIEGIVGNLTEIFEVSTKEKLSSQYVANHLAEKKFS